MASSSGDEEPSGGSGGAAPSSSSALKKGPWTSAEDSILVTYVQKHGEGNWNNVQKQSGLFRCGKSCRLRWANHLRPNLKKGTFTPEEERLIIELHAKLGNKWARMATQLPGRTDNEIKNYWNTRIKRRQRAGLPVYPPDVQAAIASGSLGTTTNSSGTTNTSSLYSSFNAVALVGAKCGGNSALDSSSKAAEFHGLTLQALQQGMRGGVLNAQQQQQQASSAGSSTECSQQQQQWSRCSSVYDHHHLGGPFAPSEQQMPEMDHQYRLACGAVPSNVGLGRSSSNNNSNMNNMNNGNSMFLDDDEQPYVNNTGMGFFIPSSSSSPFSSCSRPQARGGLKLELPSSQLSAESSDSTAVTPGSAAISSSPNRAPFTLVNGLDHHNSSSSNGGGGSSSSSLLEALLQGNNNSSSSRLKAATEQHLFSSSSSNNNANVVADESNNVVGGYFWQPGGGISFQQQQQQQAQQMRNVVKLEEAMQHGHYSGGGGGGGTALIGGCGGEDQMSTLLDYVRPGDQDPSPDGGGNIHGTAAAAAEWYLSLPQAAAAAAAAGLYMEGEAIDAMHENNNSSTSIDSVFSHGHGGILGLPGSISASLAMSSHHMNTASMHSLQAVNNMMNTGAGAASADSAAPGMWELGSCSWNNMPGACQLGDYGSCAVGDCSRPVNCLSEQHDPCAIY